VANDPFATLGVPRRFAIDLKDAEKKHLELSKALHPDRYVNASAGERRLALSKAVEVNEAWRAVRDPIKRAEAILDLEGLGNEIGETREPKPSGAFLMEVLEAREALDDAKSSKDGARVHDVVEQAKKQHRDAQGALGKAIDESLGQPQILRAAIPLLGTLRYATRFLNEAIAAEDHLSGF
jgi:molecular chaperone HscB